MTSARYAPSLFAAAMACMLGACGGSTGAQSGDRAVTIAVQPPSAQVTSGGVVSFAATVAGVSDTAVAWSVQESGGGQVGSDGSYTAPQAAGTYHVVATSVADATARALATVTVAVPAPVITVEIIPYLASLTPGQQLKFSATVSGSSDTAVAWTIQEGAAGGAIGADGSYAAPQAAGAYHVVAGSHADPSVSATATVTVSLVPVVTVALSPRTAALITGGKQTFTATVTGTSNTAVTWSVQEGAAGGAVTTAGVYTAPATPGTYHVLATSKADAAKSDAAAVTVTAPGSYVTPSAVTGDVVVAMDSSSGTQAISPWIYGANGTTNFGGSANNRWLTVNRSGGNQLTDFNWENGYTNSGDDYILFNGNPSGAAGVGGRLTQEASGIYGRTGTMGNALLFTIPLIGYVAGDWTGSATVPVAPSTTTPATPTVGSSGQTWRTMSAYRAGDAGHASATATPNTSDSAVFADDMLKWFDANLAGHKSSATEPIFLSMDGEPDSWGSRHHEIRGKTSGGVDVNTGFDELINKTVPMATTVKDILGANALVFGPVTSGWGGMVNLGHPSGDNVPAPYSFYMEEYLKKMSDASAAAGKRLLDVLDTHWYPEAETGTTITYYAGKITTAQTENTRSAVIREQTPRSLWDASYLEYSWITYWHAGMGSLQGLKEIPRMKGWINQYYPGTKIGFTEWWYGAGGDVSSAIAAADTLGIFGREGVFEASAWDQSDASGAACFMAGFAPYVNYDGVGGHVGNTYLPTVVNDAHRPADPYIPGLVDGLGNTYPGQTLERITAYASFNGAAPGQAYVVAINKDMSATLNVGFAIKHSALTKYDAYRVTGTIGSCSGPTKVATDTALTLTNAFNSSLPPQSITVFVLKP